MRTLRRIAARHVLNAAAFLVLLLTLCGLGASAVAEEFQSRWHDETTRTWNGPDFWANRLQDWQIAGGRLECVEASPQRPMRTAQLLTASLAPAAGEFSIRVRSGPLDAGGKPSPGTWTGFLIGAGGEHVDYRITALVHHRPAEDGGLLAAVDGTGRVIFRDNSTARGRNDGGAAGPLAAGDMPELAAAFREGDRFGEKIPGEFELRLDGRPEGEGADAKYTLTLSVHNAGDGSMYSQATIQGVDPSLVDGGVGLVSHLAPAGGTRGYWFRDLKLSGPKVALHPERATGPILTAMHTLSGRVLKLTAQLLPVGEKDANTASLEVRRAGDKWETVARAGLIVPGYTCTFRVPGWDDAADTPYRVVYERRDAPDGPARTAVWSGTIRKSPVDRDTVVVAGFTGHKMFTGGLKWNSNGIWFPHNELVAAVAFHKPDVLYFSGDQIYEGDLTGVQRAPLEKAELDYLDKWYRWCWAFRDLARDVPCITILDDHDVYHGNLWGAGGRHAPTQDDGGYTMPASFVNMVQRTQTAHLPDPVDPRPVEQGITVYYTRMEYGGVSFAVIEDRKWKPSPTVAVPKGKCVNGWFQNPDFDPSQEADVPGAELLGQRQEKFLQDWAGDWSHGAWMKVVLSQTIFANVATLPRSALSDAVVPRLDRLIPSDYPPDDEQVADADSNGWPQSARNRALRVMRRGFAFHLAGDQHLGSCIQYGVDAHDDAGYALCVPSIGNTFPRRWYPPMPGGNRKPGSPRYAGRFLDGFGNRITVHAVSNPVVSGREPALLHDRAPGYGIVRFHKKSRDVQIECWPRWADPSKPDAAQYPGWPITVNQLDNYGRAAAAWLPTVKVAGMTDPVVRVIDEADGEVVYTLRIAGTSFRPKAFREGAHTIVVGEPGTDRLVTHKNVPATKDNDQTLEVAF
jgi:alkaline phosphatase D